MSAQEYSIKPVSKFFLRGWDQFQILHTGFFGASWLMSHTTVDSIAVTIFVGHRRRGNCLPRSAPARPLSRVATA